MPAAYSDPLLGTLRSNRVKKHGTHAPATLKETEVKIVPIGDGWVGKTSLMLAFKDKKPSGPQEYRPTVFDNYIVMHQTAERNVFLNSFRAS